jgi:hypothetical protein
MARGAKSKYTDKQKRQASHIQKQYERTGVGKREALARAWAIVNKKYGGGNKPGGAGYGKRETQISARKLGRKRRTDSISPTRVRRSIPGESASASRLKKRSLKTAKNWRSK